MEPEDWINANYKRYEIADNSRTLHKMAHFMLQKRFDDEKGKRYFITVYVYDRDQYPKYMTEGMINFPRWGYMPTVQFSLDDSKLFFNIEINGAPAIEQTEEWAEKFWGLVGEPYYEEWE